MLLARDETSTRGTSSWSCCSEPACQFAFLPSGSRFSSEISCVRDTFFLLFGGQTSTLTENMDAVSRAISLPVACLFCSKPQRFRTASNRLHRLAPFRTVCTFRIA